MSKELICQDCGFSGKPKMKTKGSIWVEIALWLLFLFPGLIYSIWRLTSKYQACPKCEAPRMIPMDSPRGKKLRAEMVAELARGAGIKT